MYTERVEKAARELSLHVWRDGGAIWADPEPVADAIRDLYRSRAAVALEAAGLPVLIEERDHWRDEYAAALAVQAVDKAEIARLREDAELAYEDRLVGLHDAVMSRTFVTLQEARDRAYAERDRMVAALSKLFPAHLARHTDPDWEDDWRTIVCVHLPTGQATWHIHDSERPWFRHLWPDPDCAWDGHSTDEKYERLAALEASEPNP